MITVKQVLEQYDISSNDSKNLAALVHAGLLDESKLPILNRALSKSAVMMTEAEKKSLQAIVESLASCVISEQQDYLSKMDTSRPMGYPSEKDIPTVLILKRKAIRVYPDNQKVALYYCQALDRYISVPYGKNAKNLGMVMNEENLSEAIPGDTRPQGPGTVLARAKKQNIEQPKTIQGNFSRDPNDRLTTMLDRYKGKLTVPTLARLSSASGPGSVSKALELAKQTAGVNQKSNNPFHKGYEKGVEHRFKKHLKEKRLQNEDVKDFTYGDLDDDSLTSLGKDLTPGLGTARELERTKRAYKEGSYGKAALHGALTGLSGLSDAAIATGVGAGVGAAGKSVIGGVKVATKALRGLTGKTIAKKAAGETAEAAVKKAAGAGAGKGLRNNKWLKLARRGALLAAAKASSSGDKQPDNDTSTPLQHDYQFTQGTSKVAQTQLGSPSRVTQDIAASRASVAGFGGDPYRKQQNESNNLNIMKRIVENNISSHTIYLNETPITINNRVAKKVVAVYESLNRQNKKKVEKMLNEDALSFKKVINFAVGQ